MKLGVFLFGMLAVAAQAFEQAQSSPAAQPAKKAAAQPAKKTAAKQASGPGLSLGNHDSNAPINVSADSFVGDLATKIGTYLGNVIVIQGDMRLRADQVRVHVAQGKPTHIEAHGKVVVSAPSGTGTGDDGFYELGPRTITLTGRVVLTKEKDVMRGTKLVMDMNTNLAHLYAQGMPGNRVQGLFIPPPQKAGAGDKGKSGATAPKPGRVQQTIDPGTAQNPATPPK
jgi:lipopolysaccharide export system protein LptA